MMNERDVVATVARVELHELRLWIAEGWIRPAQGGDDPTFDDLDVARIRLVCDLRTDMSLPDDAVPVVLSLLDQVHGLRRELRSLTHAVDTLPADVKQAIVNARKTAR